ncbi:hypothetical protein, partial [Faecalibaculum rodentium]|uniref:hypothetical protein n=1 Tax=Faecalibaculum rodentium TaxID=1702221 RepID=UPI002490B9BF
TFCSFLCCGLLIYPNILRLVYDTADMRKSLPFSAHHDCFSEFSFFVLPDYPMILNESTVSQELL